ncbi:arylformamidase [Oceanobacillus sp. J11TS1]|uniref:arylformamidase n=1 Tax=Oceanobacillus sp. J11TS1 TaxID=2807191 RepID=UPI001B0D2D70|nr:arylformamidase [Oceanobacillus sp. J11TS1]GIO24050.1 kynurenine formamidase [Oceanobacillus sp. J11TS1]
MSKWIDITKPLNNKLAHWPETEPFHYEITATKAMTGSVNIGRITTSTHIGTHVDAPFHFLNDGKRILDLDIERYIGPCKVIDLSSFTEISENTLKTKGISYAERLLIKTALPNKPDRFPEEVPPITADGAAYMQSVGVKLVGVDTPSVDQISSKELTGHHALYKQDIYILENVMLDQVEEGDYELIALPLALEEGDGSPVRAVIKPIEES